MRQRLVLVPLLIVVASLAAGCGGGTGPANNSSTGTPSLSAGSTSLNFGSVTVGSSKTISLTVTNPGSNGTVNVSGVSVTGTGFTLTSAPTTPFSVAPGASASAKVTFSPTTAGAATGSLTVTSDASDSSISIPLSGTGVNATSATLAVNPTSLSFGSVALGSNQALSGALVATGGSVNVTTVDQTGQGFTLSGITFPVTVTPGQNVPFTVTFAPSVSGSASGSLSFESNASNSPANVSLSGTGTGSSGGSHSVGLSWQASTSTVAGYNVYRGVVSGGPYVKINTSLDAATTYSDATVVSGTTYYYVATSVDSSNNESPFSNEVSAAVP